MEKQDPASLNSEVPKLLDVLLPETLKDSDCKATQASGINGTLSVNKGTETTTTTGTNGAMTKNEMPLSSSGGHDAPWEPSLTDDELKILEELGLGVAVDITAKHPWIRKSAFQAKTLSRAGRNELIVVNESNQFLRTSEQVETYTEVQAGLESSFRPDPSKPISVNIAADFHRSNTRSKTIKGTTILTRTVAFRAKDPTRKTESEEEFETHLHKWLVKQDCVSCNRCKNEAVDDNPHQCPDCVYSHKTNHFCIDYLKELGGVTHYVSSITLGATKYHIVLNSTLFHSFSSSSGVGVDSFVSASTKSRASRKVFQSSSKEQQIGKIPQHDSADPTELLQFRTKGEAVVRCSYNSLANLVSHPKLRQELELGIQEYIDLQKNGTRKFVADIMLYQCGPYHIATAEMHYMSTSETSDERKRLHWKLCGYKERDESGVLTTNYRIECTHDKKEASNFYLKPFARYIGGEKYFYIATDPEDVHRFTSTERRSYADQVELDREPQRYVQIGKQPPHQLEAVLVVKKYKGDSAFKLKNPQDNETYPLSRSQWLPEASLGSQPYLICREGQSFKSRHKIRSVSIEEKEGRYIVVHAQCLPSTHPYSDRLFILEPGHKT